MYVVLLRWANDDNDDDVVLRVYISLYFYENREGCFSFVLYIIIS